MAQPCNSPGWVAGQPSSGITGQIHAMASLPNGDIVVGGSITTAGNTMVNNIARWNGSEWLPLGSGLDSEVLSLAVLPNGELIAGGTFQHAGGLNASRIAKWNGTAWSSIGQGMPGAVSALAVLPNGDVLAGGGVLPNGSMAGVFLQRWNGSAWSSMNLSVVRAVTALAVLPNGDVIAAGLQMSSYAVVRWNGATWTKLGSSFSDRIRTLAVLPQGEVVAGGEFSGFGTSASNYVAMWNGTTWVALGSGVLSFVRSLVVLPNGDLLASSAESPGSWSSPILLPLGGAIARWDGTVWHPVGTRSVPVTAMAMTPEGTVALAESSIVLLLQRLVTSNVYQLNGNTQTIIGPGLDGPITEIVTHSHGDTIVGGGFETAGNVPAKRFARFDGSEWAAYPHVTPAGGVTALATLPGERLLAGGRFLPAGSTIPVSLIEGNGATWSPLNGQLSMTSGLPVRTISVLQNSEVIVGGEFSVAGGINAKNIARWNGTDWSALGSGIDGPVYTAVEMPNHHIIAGGLFSSAGGTPANNIARWDGTHWEALAAEPGGRVSVLRLLPNGDLVAAVNVTNGSATTGWVTIWNGSTWSPLGGSMNGYIHDITVLPTGQIVAAGAFTHIGSQTVNYIGMWDGAAWAALGSGMNFSVLALGVLPNGNLVAGGEFTTVNGSVSAFYAEYRFTQVPWIVGHPASQLVSASQILTLSATPANGYSNVAVQWLRNGTPIVDGPGGASAGGGTVAGASGQLASPTRRSTATLTISNAQPGDSGEYTAVFSNACGDVSSDAALVSISTPCPADFDSDTFVDDADFVLFTQQYGVFACDDPGMPGSCSADLTGDGFVDDSDFVLFAAAYGAFTCP